MTTTVDGQSLLDTCQKHIEDMRSLIQCKICIKPLYEPFSLGCGHSFCYSCLTSWFTGDSGDVRRRQSMKCPDCRAVVVLEPSPNYVLRDLVHMFIGRTELIPEDESIDQHASAIAEEAVQLTADRSSVGLFKGAFRTRQAVYQGNAGLAPQRPMYDPHDGVERCPECHWELEGDYCNQCHWSISDAGSFSDEIDGQIHAPNSPTDDEIYAHNFHILNRLVHPDSSQSPTGSFLDALEHENNLDALHHRDEHDSVITISSDVDDIDPVDHELAGIDADIPSDVESDLPVAMGGLGRRVRRNYESDTDAYSTNYDDSAMDESEFEETEDDSSEMDSFIEHDTPHKRLHNTNAGVDITGDESDSDTNTNYGPSPTPSPTPLPITNTSAAASNCSSEESSEDERRSSPVLQSRPSRRTRVVLDDSDEDEDEKQNQNDPHDKEDDGDESDTTTTPAQQTATRRSHLQGQRARRTNLRAGRTRAKPTQVLTNLYAVSGGLDDGSANHWPHPTQAATDTSRRGWRQTYVAG